MALYSYLIRFIFMFSALSVILFLFNKKEPNYTFKDAVKSAFFISVAATVAQFLWDMIIA
jgi:hypothetical protein